MRRLSLFLSILMLLALAMVPASAASATTANTNCQSSSSGWQKVDFQTWFNNSLQHALDAGMTVDQLLAALGATSLQDLANLSLPGFQSADKNGDGLICQKFTPSVINIGIPYASSFRDNIDATQS